MFAGAARLEGGRLAHVRLGMGAVADRPVRLLATEAALAGARIDDGAGAALAERARAAVLAEVVPITDVRSTREYRARTAANLVARFVLELAARAATEAA
jgi:xanthine dehydrogenase small subunit